MFDHGDTAGTAKDKFFCFLLFAVPAVSAVSPW
jgi:hypothetical protein